MGRAGENDNDGDYEKAIRSALSAADGMRAVYEGCRAVRSAIVKEYKRRPAEAGLIAAHLGAQLLYFARALPDYRPPRPRGCPKVPAPEHLLAALDLGLSRAEEAGQG